MKGLVTGKHGFFRELRTRKIDFSYFKVAQLSNVFLVFRNISALFKTSSRQCIHYNVEMSLVVVVYHETIVAIEHGLLMKFWVIIIGSVLRTAGSSLI